MTREEAERIARARYPWAFVEPEPYEQAKLIREDARRALTATTSSLGYELAPDGGWWP